MLSVSVFSLLADADAIKSSGTPNQKFGHQTKGIVCGSKLCFELFQQQLSRFNVGGVTRQGLEAPSIGANTPSLGIPSVDIPSVGGISELDVTSTELVKINDGEYAFEAIIGNDYTIRDQDLIGSPFPKTPEIFSSIDSIDSVSSDSSGLPDSCVDCLPDIDMLPEDTIYAACPQQDSGDNNSNYSRDNLPPDGKTTDGKPIKYYRDHVEVDLGDGRKASYWPDDKVSYVESPDGTKNFFDYPGLPVDVTRMIPCMMGNQTREITILPYTYLQYNEYLEQTLPKDGINPFTSPSRTEQPPTVIIPINPSSETPKPSIIELPKTDQKQEQKSEKSSSLPSTGMPEALIPEAKSSSDIMDVFGSINIKNVFKKSDFEFSFAKRISTDEFYGLFSAESEDISQRIGEILENKQLITDKPIAPQPPDVKEREFQGGKIVTEDGDHDGIPETTFVYVNPDDSIEFVLSEIYIDINEDGFPDILVILNGTTAEIYKLVPVPIPPEQPEAITDTTAETTSEITTEHSDKSGGELPITPSPTMPNQESQNDVSQTEKQQPDSTHNQTPPEDPFDPNVIMKRCEELKARAGTPDVKEEIVDGMKTLTDVKTGLKCYFSSKGEWLGYGIESIKNKFNSDGQEITQYYDDSVEVIGTDKGEKISGTDGSDHLYGQGGNDIINGGDGGDFALGGTGDDIITLGKGNDSAFGGTGNDTILVNSGDVDTNGSDNIFGGVGTDTVVFNGFTPELVNWGEDGNLLVFQDPQTGGYYTIQDVENLFIQDTNGTRTPYKPFTTILNKIKTNGLPPNISQETLEEIKKLAANESAIPETESEAILDTSENKEDSKMRELASRGYLLTETGIITDSYGTRWGYLDESGNPVYDPYGFTPIEPDDPELKMTDEPDQGPIIYSNSGFFECLEILGDLLKKENPQLYEKAKKSFEGGDFGSLTDKETEEIKEFVRQLKENPSEEFEPCVQHFSELEKNESEGGVRGAGCLVATAAFGSELAPQVQLLREVRNNVLFSTSSGTGFMTTFNAIYYSFSPTIADWERKSPVFKEVVKASITPMLSTLSILNYVDIDSEHEMLGYGIGIILLNIGMYFVVPALMILRLKSRFTK